MRPSFTIFLFPDTPPPEIYTLSLHDALPICHDDRPEPQAAGLERRLKPRRAGVAPCPRELDDQDRSEEHTSELQSRPHIVCRLLLEKKKNVPSSSDFSPFCIWLPTTISC